jgi:hypothetical protein
MKTILFLALVAATAYADIKTVSGSGGCILISEDADAKNKFSIINNNSKMFAQFRVAGEATTAQLDTFVNGTPCKDQFTADKITSIAKAAS